MAAVLFLYPAEQLLPDRYDGDSPGDRAEKKTGKRTAEPVLVHRDLPDDCNILCCCFCAGAYGRTLLRLHAGNKRTVPSYDLPDFWRRPGDDAAPGAKKRRRTGTGTDVDLFSDHVYC